MLAHYFKIIFRNISRNKFYTFINVIGLSVGIAASLILLLFVQYEKSFDQFHENKDNIYRIISIGQESGNYEARAPYKLAPGLAANFPEIEKICRVREYSFSIKKDESFIHENTFIQADTSFFDIFSFNIINGNRIDPLASNGAIVISESMAEKYFNDENPVGKILEIKHRKKTYKQTITAVMEDIPENSHIQADFVLPIYTTIWGYEDLNRKRSTPSFESWGNNSFLTYILINGAYQAEDLVQKFPEFIRANIPANTLSGTEFSFLYDLQNLKDIHLNSEILISDVANKGSLNHIYLFGGIAILILLIAIINYIILSTAKSLSRTKEIGLRKVIGANRAKIMKQVLGESLFISFISLLPAVLFAELFLPKVNDLLGKTIEISIIDNPIILGGLLLIAFVTGIISGSYMAFYLSSFKPVDVFRSQVNLGLRGSIFQKSLIITQLIIFIGLIICSSIIYNQVRYMKNNDVLGFEKENLLSLLISDKVIIDSYKSFKAELLTNPDIHYVASSNVYSPAFGTSITAVGTRIDPKSGKKFWYSYSGGLPENTKNMIIYENNLVDFDYIEALGIKIIEGRSFNSEFTGDRRAVIVNEAFIKHFNIENPLTEKFKFTDEHLKIIGIMANYHSKSLTEKVLPVILTMSNRHGPTYMRQIVIKLSGNNTSDALTFLEEKWKEFYPNAAFSYTFTDTHIDHMYRTEMNLATLIASFAVLAIIIASLGLFGLSLFIAQKKTREIVIRKTMGASVGRIVFSLIKQFLNITIIANILAIPITYYYMDKWLQNFEYQSLMDYRIFIGAALSSIALCIITVSFHSTKAAIIKPVSALKYE